MTNTFNMEFNRAVKVQVGLENITSDAGLLLLREADAKLGFTEHLAEELSDPRNQELIRYKLVELIRERLYGMAMGYATQDDADRLAHDPAMKIAAWDRPGEEVINQRCASQPTQSRLVDCLSSSQNRNVLREGLADIVERHVRATGGDHAPRHATIDIDSFPVAVHGSQPGAEYNGYYRDTVYHPLVASFSVNGDYDSTRTGHRLGNGFIHATLRAGNVHTAEGILRFMHTTIRKSKRLGYVVDFRFDAGIVNGRVLDLLTDEKQRFLGRIKSNAIIERMAEPYISRPVGRPPSEGYEYTVELGMYRAESWKHAQRLVLVVVDRPAKSGQLNLSPDYFFLIVGWKEEELSADGALAKYRPRGTFEDRIGEFNQAIGVKLSSPSFEENEATFLLSLLAFNMLNVLRIEVEDVSGSCFDLGRFQRDVLKAGARVVKHSRRLIVHVATVVLAPWQKLLACISNWVLPARFPQPCGASKRDYMPLPKHAHLHEVRRH